MTASLIGGMILGAAAMLLLLANGRIAGVSGIFGRLLGGRPLAANAAFVIGLTAGPLLYAAAFGQLPALHIAASAPVAVVAGLLVGFGSRMGSGCTSGHGILGLARFSRRSFVAVATFMTVGMLVATIAGFWR